MNLERVDLNLLIYLDVLLREKNVTRAAEQLGVTQPAMSNILRRLRTLFNDPLLIRSSEGMTPTERALELQPRIRDVLSDLSMILEPRTEFRPYKSNRVFRIMTSDYAEATLVPRLVKALRAEAPNVVLDFLTPSDVSYRDMEQGKVDLAINRFNEIPQSFHQILVWRDSFSCLLNPNHPNIHNLNLKNYLDAHHIWVSKTGMGIGFGVNPDKQAGLGWIDQALERIGQKRKISIFTRHYQMPALLTKNVDLIATLPTRIARQQAKHQGLIIKDPPFYIPDIELKMAWCPLLHHHPAHRWLRQLILYVARQMVEEEGRELYPNHSQNLHY
ncbi:MULTISPECIES: LysR family transcriptional regulator [Acinetobacter]|uniref:LysR family transcriptional regulator n=1 Tax=Acinetobacter pollinis TaxID=2605270 RepID=A0ABU6DR08_9GAMM|nr:MULTISPECIES: LysR family transcriptional regulator [Acinetobacter]MBF7690492.1 LysR family transcriptional regulator [Acinetobacter pollinis]MBF7693425.1 LysR family transcriptional regulator [Acinetobacter pollinis]MBF7697976.1 LysR family transcriptional regulator [Acinetobacter pollinis]MBF7700937.1 LysR family transcriptional regulator [Acinetobacter pollinis]MEB5476274.1 LysR family transcriptional regulator [Acinetobacter pollinis]